MKITEKKTITKEIEVTAEILCNKCEKSMWKRTTPSLVEDNDFCVWGSYNSLMNVNISNGYSTLRFSVCSDCLKEFTDSFKLPVTEDCPIIIG